MQQTRAASVTLQEHINLQFKIYVYKLLQKHKFTLHRKDQKKKQEQKLSWKNIDSRVEKLT